MAPTGTVVDDGAAHASMGDPGSEGDAASFDWRKVGSLVLTALVVLGWFAFLRPGNLGGSTGYVMVAGRSMEPTLHDGDGVIVRRHDTYDVGDIIAYRIPDGDEGAGLMVIHRIVGGSAGDGYVTRGDNRSADDRWLPRPGDILGKQAVVVPRAGELVRRLRTPAGLAVLAGALTTLWLLGGRRRPDPPTGDPG